MIITFTGHRDVPTEKTEQIRSRLRQVIGELILEGADVFICGGAVGFDMLAEEEILRYRAEGQSFRFFILQFSPDYDRFWSDEQKERMKDIVSRSDGIRYLFDSYHRGAPLIRDREMASHADVLVCWLEKESGGTYETVKYALKSGKKVINLSEKQDFYTQERFEL